jgi:hypothetical protein
MFRIIHIGQIISVFWMKQTAMLTKTICKKIYQMMVIMVVLYLIMMLNVVLWNITGIMSSAGYHSNILDEGNIGICGLSTQRNFHFMDSISSKFMRYTVCDINNVRKGGVSIMWHRRYNNLISKVETDSDRIIGIQLEIGSSLFVYFFQVYLPCSNYSVTTYNEVISMMYDIYNTYCVSLSLWAILMQTLIMQSFLAGAQP